MLLMSNVEKSKQDNDLLHLSSARASICAMDNKQIKNLLLAVLDEAKKEVIKQ